MRATMLKERSAASTLPSEFVGMAIDALQPWKKAYDDWRGGMAELFETKPTKHRPRSKHGTGCACDDCCQTHDCRCECCVADADLLIEARIGERRVVPITIENRWRRERPIELELSSWTVVNGQTLVIGSITTATQFTLPPCGEQTVLLALEIGTPASQDNRLPEAVTACAVAYADLRIIGCDLRSIRIAVAVLPSDCNDYVVDCACGCC